MQLEPYRPTLRGKSLLLRLSVPLVVLFTSLFLWVVWPQRTWSQPRQGPTPVAVSTVVEQSVATSIEVVGEVEPHLATTLSTEIAGLTLRFDLKEGDAVQEGQTVVVHAVNSDEESPIAWIIVDTKRDINEVRLEAEEVIQPRLERVEGVGAVWLFGGQEREVHVVLDYAAMAARGLSIQ